MCKHIIALAAVVMVPAFAMVATISITMAVGKQNQAITGTLDHSKTRST